MRTSKLGTNKHSLTKYWWKDDEAISQALSLFVEHSVSRNVIPCIWNRKSYSLFHLEYLHFLVWHKEICIQLNTTSGTFSTWMFINENEKNLNETSSINFLFVLYSSIWENLVRILSSINRQEKNGWKFRFFICLIAPSARLCYKCFEHRHDLAVILFKECGWFISAN